MPYILINIGNNQAKLKVNSSSYVKLDTCSFSADHNLTLKASSTLECGSTSTANEQALLACDFP